MVVYEVTADVDTALRDEYVQWLAAHVAEILALPGFLDAGVEEVVDPVPAGRVRVCMRYRLDSAGALARYLEQHAPRLRADGVALFGDRVATQRRVLRPLDGFARDA